MILSLRRTARLAVCLLLASGASVGQAADEAVTAPLDWERGLVARTLGEGRGTFDKPRSGVKYPLGIQTGRYGFVQVVRDVEVEYAIDVEAGYERVWIDHDGDRDLTDEPTLRWSQRGLRQTVATTIEVLRGPDRAPVPVGVSLTRIAFGPAGEIRVGAAAHRWGAALVRRKLVQVALEDGNGNVRFDDVGEDRVYVDLDGSGEYDLGPGSREAVTLGDVVKIGEGYWRLGVVDPDGSAIVFTRERAEARQAGAGTAPPLPPSGRPVPRPTETYQELLRVEEAGASEAETLTILGKLGGLASAEAGAFLRKTATEDRRASVRAAATLALGNPACREAWGPHLEALAMSGDSVAANAAVEALHRMVHPERARIWAAVLDTAPPSVAASAARYLAELGSGAARGAITRTIRDSRSRRTRWAVYKAARESTYGAPLKAMLLAAEDSSGRLATLALGDLFHLRHTRTRPLALLALERRNREVTQAVLPILVGIGDADSMAAVWAHHGDRRYRDMVGDLCAGAGGGPALPYLFEALASKNVDEQLFACSVLARIRSREVADALLDAFGAEQRADVSDALLRALGQQDEDRVVPALGELAEDGARVEQKFAWRHLGDPVLRGHPTVNALMQRDLRSADKLLRLLAIQAVDRSGAVELLPLVQDSLEFSRRQVRHAAATVLGKHRRRDSVAPLVARLQHEGQAWVREAIGTALFRLTGMNLYDEPGLWKDWFEANQATFLVPDEVPILPQVDPNDQRATYAVKEPRFYGIPLDTDDIVFVIDQSGSMASLSNTANPETSARETKFQTASRELLAAVAALEDECRVNVIYFESSVHPWRAGLQRLDRTTRRTLDRFVKTKRPEGGTNLYDALEKALLTKGAETIVILSDGEPTTGRFVDPNSIVAAVNDLNRRRAVEIHAVSIGGGSSLLRRLCTMHEGTYVER